MRNALKKDFQFPLKEAQLKSIQALKDLVKDIQMLRVPDEAAAIEAMRAYAAGDPPTGRPYEGGVDTSKIAMGGVCGQCVENDGKLLVLMYWSAPLSASQSQWHPF